MQPRTLATVTLLLFQAAPPERGGRLEDDPRRVVRSAFAAVEGDSAAALSARWNARLRQDGGDRAALLGLATVARLTHDNAGAEERYERLSAGAVRGDRLAGYAQLGFAQTAHAVGNFDVARTWLTAAAATAIEAGDPVLRSEILLSFATLRARQPDRAAALAATLATLDSAARLAPDSAPDVLAGLHGRRGTVYSILGRTAEAAADLRSCVEYSERAGVPRVGGTCLHSLGTELDRRGQTDSALAALVSAAEVQARARDRRGLGLTLGRHGAILRRLGDYGAARELLYRSVAELTLAGSSAADELIHLGELSRAAGDRAAALDYAARGTAALEKERGFVGLAYAHGLQAVLAADVGDFATAERLQRGRLAWARSDGQPAVEAEVLTAIAELYERRGDLERAQLMLDSAAAARRKLAPGVGAERGEAGVEDLDYRRGRVSLRQGHLDAAERSLRRYLGSRRPGQHLHSYRARARLAEVRMRRGDLDGAERELAEAGDALDRARAGMADAELRLLVFQLDAYDEADLGVPAVIAALAAGGRSEAAFVLAERRRARELADRIVRDDALRSGGATATGVRPTGAGGGVGDAMGTVAEIAAALPDSTALLEFVTGANDSPTTLLVVTRAGVEAHRLPPADSLSRPIERFRALLESGAEPSALGRALGAALLDPASATLARVRRLIVVPDGPLHRVPFDALRTADGRYLMEGHAVALAPSAAVARQLWRRAAAAPPQTAAPVRLLALGDPDFLAGGGAPVEGAAVATFRSAFASAGGLPRLLGSGDEVRAVARYTSDARVWLGAAASESEFKRASLSGVQLLHLATHALVDEGRASRTAIALAPGDGEDGFLSLGELAALRLDGALVVLSACRSAGGMLVGGEGIQGLATAFLQAGARAVVATGWEIGDRGAVQLVDDLYGALADGQPVDEALRTAKLAAIRRGEPPSAWAAFTVVGDPTVTVPLRAPGAAPRPMLRFLLISLALAAAAAAVVAAVRSARRRSSQRPL